MENKNDKQNKSIGVSDMFHAVKLDILENISKAQKLGYVTANMMDITTEKKLLDTNGDLKSLLNIRNQWKARVEILEQITASREADMPAVKPPIAVVECYGQYYSSDDVKIFIKENAELKKENGKLKTNIEVITHKMGNIAGKLEDLNDYLGSCVLDEQVVRLGALVQFCNRTKGGPTPIPIITPLNIDSPDDGGD